MSELTPEEKAVNAKIEAFEADSSRVYEDSTFNKAFKETMKTELDKLKK